MLSIWLLAVSGLIVAALTLLKRHRDAKIRRCTADTDLSGQIAVVTGANTGLGRQLALDLSRHHATVVMACRDLEKAQTAIEYITQQEPTAKLIPMELRLDSLESVEEFARAFEKDFSKLKLLVNNAGIMGAPFALSQNGLEMHFAVNHLGHFHLTNLLTPFLKRAKPSRIVNVTSGYYRKYPHEEGFENFLKDFPQVPMDLDPLKAYARSKLANCLHTYQLAKYLKADGVWSLAARPGFVRGTELGRHFTTIFKTFAAPLIWFMSKNVDEGVQTILECCLGRLRELESGALYENCQKQDFDARLVNDERARDFWRLSEKLVAEALDKKQ